MPDLVGTRVGLPAALSAATGLILGGDANIYRASADALKTDDALQVTGPLTAASGIPRMIVGAGVPSATIGNEGDMYLDTTTLALWGPKALINAAGQLLSNPSAEVNATGLTIGQGGGAALVRSNEQASHGGWSFKVTQGAAGSGSLDARVASGSRISVTPGQAYSAAADFRSALGRNIQVIFDWYDAAGARINIVGPTVVPSVAGAWTRGVATNFIAPPLSVTASVIGQFSGTTANEVAYVDQMVAFVGAALPAPAWPAAPVGRLLPMLPTYDQVRG